MKAFLLTVTLGIAAIAGFQTMGCVERSAEARGLASAIGDADDEDQSARPNCMGGCEERQASCIRQGNSTETCANSYNACVIQCNMSPTLVDNGIATSPANPPRDPIDDPAGYYEDLRDAYAKGGLAPAVMLALFGLVVTAQRRIAWLREGRRAVYTVAGISVLAALVDVTAGVGSWQLVVAAIGSAIALILSPAPSPQLLDRTRIPKAIEE